MLPAEDNGPTVDIRYPQIEFSVTPPSSTVEVMVGRSISQFPAYQLYLLTPHPAYPQGGRQQEAIGLGPMNSGSQREALNRMPSQTPLPLEPPTPPAKPPPTPPYANERSRGGSLEGLLGGPSDGVFSYLLTYPPHISGLVPRLHSCVRPSASACRVS